MEWSCLGTRAAAELGLDPSLPFDCQGEAFSRMLAEHVPIGGWRQRLMFEKTCRLIDRFIVFRRRRGLILCEASANTFLQPGRRLSHAEEEHLTELGWLPPNGAFPRRHEDVGCPNWHFDVPVGRAASAALIMIRTLRDVCGANVPEDVFVRSSSVYFECKDLCGRYLIANDKEQCECDRDEVMRQYKGVYDERR